MKKFSFLILLFCAIISNAQTLSIDFEEGLSTTDFVDFNGGTATVIENSQADENNPSATVAQIIRDGGEIWAGSKIILADNLDFTTASSLTMKIYTSAAAGTTVKFKLENDTDGAIERDVVTTSSNEWETLIWDFTGVPADYNTLVFMFDFGNIGDGSANSTFLFDDIEQISLGAQLDLPVTFETEGINYTTTDFGGTISSLIPDPTNSENTVVQVIKTNEAATWAGTTIGTNAGFASNIPLSLTDSKMSVRVWSPDAGIPIRLKVEDSNDPTHTCETQTNTTKAGEWETLEFDFTNQATGTELLSVGLEMAWTFNMASIFFNFDVEGAVAGEKTYYFDNVQFGESVISNNTTIKITELSVFPNPAHNLLTISSPNTQINSITIFNLQGQAIYFSNSITNKKSIDIANLTTGTYFALITTSLGTETINFLKK